ncbi:MAG TPA: PKD domain-containing protein, partial [Flavobacterium sp.]|nr:PKD domain-containing protein [Flavobacterium sp.]
MLLLLAGTSLQAQWKSGLWTEKQAYNWYFGVAAGIEFNSSPPVGVADSAIEADLSNPYDGSVSTFIEGTGSISDAQGNLLFYTNGVTVWNANHEIMENGEGLLGNSSSTQSGLIVPAPNNPNIFYLFSVNGSILQTSEATFIADGVFYSEIDMSLDGNMGAVTVNKNVPLSSDVAEKITAVHHANGQDVWVIIQNSAGDEFKAFLVSETGVNTTPVVSDGGVYIVSSDVGAIKASPDGNKIAAARPYFGAYVVEVFDFNRETGEISEILATLNNTDFTGELLGCYGIEFSPNSRFLYASTMFTGRVYQFDVTAGSEQEIKDSGNIIGQLSDDINYSMQLAPDGKIYIAHGDFFSGPFEPYLGSQSTLNVINFPNNEGLASGFAEDAVDLLDGRNDVSLPSFIQSYFASGIIYEGQCDGESFSFSTLRIPGISEISWDFGDPDSGNNISTDLEPAHIFSAPGTYTVTAVITSNGVQQTATKEVIVFPAPDAVIPPLNELMQCANAAGEGTFNLTALNTTILNGQNPDEHTVIYYATSEDMEAGNAIPVPGEFITAGQVIYAVVTNIVNGCTSTIQ